MIYYTKKGQGPAIFLLHGFPNDHTIWDRTAANLIQNYTVYQPDFPGTGRSEFYSETLFITDLANELVEIFLKENIQKAIVVGHSMGGYITLNFAHRFPEKVAGISLVHSSAYPDTESVKQNRRKAMELIGKGDLEKLAFLRAMIPRLFTKEFADKNPEIVKAFLNKAKEISGKALIAYYHAMIHRQDETFTLKNADFPIQWIIGNEDLSATKKNMLEQAHIATINKVSIYQHCAHLSMLETPEALIKDLKIFFEFIFEA